jgi:hypothetical protein
MAQALIMVHEHDPKQELLRELGGLHERIELLGSGVLVAVYVRPERMAIGNLVLPEKYRDEDLHQGKVGLVLKAGPIAFEDDATHRFGNRIPTRGEWVVCSVGETFAFMLGKVKCRVVEDVSVRAIIDQPDIVL